ncbi:6607_t:CDS:2 [Dentiscutata erythropus]|uniref:6607_t:CDS:1 n=1 Tax=Dentiscutata erythropus TaxID=1348616 RepID=A0A9N9ACM8_9GLOM|nr:6607_t:CDS:2 [Dentiscutata erythropus]
MWHKEPLEVKLKFQLLADIAKLKHIQKYPEYKYQPHRPYEKRKKTKKKIPPQHGKINLDYNEFFNQNVNKYDFQLISNNLNLSNEILKNSQEITSMFN